jgi:hypothetical protein
MTTDHQMAMAYATQQQVIVASPKAVKSIWNAA